MNDSNTNSDPAVPPATDPPTSDPSLGDSTPVTDPSAAAAPTVDDPNTPADPAPTSSDAPPVDSEPAADPVPAADPTPIDPPAAPEDPTPVADPTPTPAVVPTPDATPTPTAPVVDSTPAPTPTPDPTPAVDTGSGSTESPELSPAEAIVAFTAWLTTLHHAVRFGAKHDASRPAELAEEFRLSQGMAEPRDGFTAFIKPYPIERDLVDDEPTPAKHDKSGMGANTSAK